MNQLRLSLVFGFFLWFLLPGLRAEEAGIWLEAEAAPRHNFPPPDKNPYKAVEFWETDLLSGGEWVGMLWDPRTEAPFFEFDIEVPEAGEYSLYVRKFSTGGVFRWRVDDGEWQEPPPYVMHRPMDTVSMRQTGERITLSWFYMGTAAIGEGAHKLRIEVVVPATRAARAGLPQPLGFDAFLLTKTPFFPSGKLRPGERYPSMEDRAFAFQPASVLPENSEVHLRDLNEAFAGQNGGIAVRDGNLVFRTTGTPVRMLGVNYLVARLAPPEALDHLASLLAGLGLNFVRFDIAPAVQFRKSESEPVKAEMNKVALEQILRAVAAFKKQGIYTALTWDLRNTENFQEIFLRAPPPVPPGGNAVFDNSPYPDIAALAVFDPVLREQVGGVWEQVLSAELEPGLRLAEDPALFLITLGQQASLLNDLPLPWDDLTPAARERMLEAWRAWAAKEHGSEAKALAAWGLGETEAFARVPQMPEVLAERGAMHRDVVRFLADAQTDYFAAEIAQMRDAGYRGLVSCSNKPNGKPEILGFADIETRMAGDVIERHGFLRGDFDPKYDVWSFTEGAIFGDRSPVRLDAMQGLEAARLDLPLRAPLYSGKPSLLTEIGAALPNRFAGEMPLVTLLLSSLQGVEAVGFASIGEENWSPYLSTSRIQIFTPGLLGQMPALALAYRKGLLPGPARAGTFEITKESAFALKPIPFYEPPNTQINARLQPPEQTDSSGKVEPALWLTGAVGVRLNAKKDQFEPAADEMPDVTGTIEAAGSQVRWNPSRHLLEVNAPAFQAAAGDLRNAGAIRLGAIEIQSPMRQGIVCAVALDGQPLDFSRRMLLQVFSWEANSGFFAQPTGDLSVIRSLGRPPLLVGGIAGEVAFLRPDADDLVITALDDNGVPVVPAGFGASLRLLPATRYYLVEK